MGGVSAHTRVTYRLDELGWRTAASVKHPIRDRRRLAPLGGVERALGKVRFARLIHSGARDLGGPAVRAACGGNLKPALVATQGNAASTAISS
jgi:hypothetical protein